MRKLEPPEINDAGLLENLRKSRGDAAKTITPHIPDIQVRYNAYISHQGDPWIVETDHSFDPFRKQLQSLYKNPPVALAFITALRNSVQGACPVCGRDSIGTLDHYLPKASYAEFSFYSRNLIPACDRCNNARNNLVRGISYGERPLHPYFDAFAERRIMTIRAEPDWRAPRLTPIPFDVDGDELVVVQWHIENVIRPAGIDAYLTSLWGSLVNEPEPFIGSVASSEAVASNLEQLVKMEVAAGKSQNCWRSCFYHGLMINNDALDYLAGLVT